MAIAYGLKYYKRFTSRKQAGENAFSLEIYQKNYDGSARVIGEWQGVTLEVDGDEDPVSPIQKTIVNFSIVDMNDEPDTADVKYGNWQEFFTPDSTMYKVVIKHGDAAVWSGYMTPDNWQESLAYRGTITITARDNIGHLQDFEFDLQAGEGGTATLGDLLNAAFRKIDFPMGIVKLLDLSQLDNLDEPHDYQDITFGEGTTLSDLRINVLAFEGKDWYDVLEQVMSSLGLCFRYIGNNRCLVTYLRYLPFLGHLKRNGIPLQNVIFLGGGTRTLSPAYKQIIDKIEFDFDEEAVFDAGENLQLSSSSTTYLTNIWTNNTASNMRPTPASVHINGAIAENDGKAATGWETGNGFAPTDGRKSSVIDLEHTALLAANESNPSSVFVYNINALLPGLSGTLEVQLGEYPVIYAGGRSLETEYRFLSRTTTGGGSGSVQRVDFTPRLSSFKYSIQYTTLDGTTYYKAEAGWQKTSATLTYNNVDGKGMSSVSFNLQATSTVAERELLTKPGRLTFVIAEINFVIGDTTILSTPQGCGLYLAVTGFSLIAETAGKLESDTTTTINDETFNMTNSRSPELGFITRNVDWQTPQNYGNAFYALRKDGVVAPVLSTTTWGKAKASFAAFMAKQVLQYHQSPMEILDGDCMPSRAGMWDYSATLQYINHNYLLQGGTYDFISGVMTGARLREFEFYEDLWDDESGGGGDPGGGGSTGVSYTATLVSVGSNKILVINTLRNSAGLTLKDAKTIADNAPAVIGSTYTKNQADNIKTAVEAAGGSVTITKNDNS